MKTNMKTHLHKTPKSAIQATNGQLTKMTWHSMATVYSMSSHIMAAPADPFGIQTVLWQSTI